MASRLWGLGFRVYRNCIGFGSGVLGGFAGFCRGFCFCFCRLIFGFGGRLEGSAFCFCFLAGLDWAGLGCRWAVAGLFSRNRNCIGFGSGVLPGFAFCFCSLIFGCGGRLAGSAFCLCFLAGLGWAAAGLFSRTFRESSKLLKRQFNSKRNSHNFYLSCS